MVDKPKRSVGAPPSGLKLRGMNLSLEEWQAQKLIELASRDETHRSDIARQALDFAFTPANLKRWAKPKKK